jgi:Right handed beta helix region
MLLRHVFLTVFLIAVCAGSSARAQNVESYVSSSGLDTNNCSLTSPCLGFSTAHANTLPGGSISCLSAPSSALLTITKSITIDCTGVAFSGVHGVVEVTINLPSSDALQTVRLKGYTINGFGQGTRGVQINAAGTVILEDMKIIQHTQQGVIDLRTSPGELRITDTAISRNTGPGVAVVGAAGNVAILDNVTLDGNQYGVVAGAGNTVSISRSTLASNTISGVEADPGAQIIVDNSTITHNGVGVQSYQSIRLSNNNIAFNTTAISGSGSGTFGNNRFSGNGTIGTAPSALGGATSDLGQQ